MKFRVPKDMDQTFHTLIHAGAKLDIDELGEVRRHLERFLGKEFAQQSDSDRSCLN